MKYTFSIHGVPYGSQSWGDISDNEYLKSFYNSVSASNVPTQMIVDIRYSGNTICSYYHYLMLSNVDDYESRPGSYFGMTICFEDGYCSDFVELYKLFQTCFEKLVLQSVLVKSGERYKYALADFDSANNTAILKRVDGAIRKNIPLFEHNMVVFPENFSPKHRNDGGIEEWAIDDVGNGTFVKLLFRDSMASISPYYPISYKKVEILQGDNRTKDRRIKALESDNGNLQNENEGLKTRISNQERDIASKGETIKYQNGVISEQKGSIATFKAEKEQLENNLKETRSQVEALKEELKQAQNNRDDETLQKCLVTLKSIAQKRVYTDQLIDAINPKLKKAEEKIEQIDKQLNRKKSFRLISNHFQLGALIVVAIIAIAGILLPNQNSEGGKPLHDIVTKGDVETMIKNALTPINTKIEQVNSNISSKPSSELLSEDIHLTDGDELTWITIEPLEPDELPRRGQTYTLFGRKKNPHGSGNIDLEYGGGQFLVKFNDGEWSQLPSDDNGKTATFTIGDTWNKFSFKYTMNNVDIVKPRDFTISKN